MNNKFIKRVAAVVLGVAVLSTCAFAATIVESETTYNLDETVTFSYETTGDKVSYIAYAVRDGEKKEIVAIGQVDNAPEGDSFNITIDASKLDYSEKIRIESGDSAGTFDFYEIPAQEYTYSTVTTVGTESAPINVDGSDFIDVVKAEMTVIANKAGKYTLTGLKGKVGSTEKVLTPVEDTVFPTNVSVEAGSPISVANIYLAGLTEEQLAETTITIMPNFTYSAN